MARPYIIAVEGLIGAGKTTLLKTLQQNNTLENTAVIHQSLQLLEQHPTNKTVHSLTELYKNPKGNSCIFQNFVLDVYDDRMAYMFNNYGTYSSIVLDRSLDSCNVFTNTNIDLFTSFRYFYLNDKYMKRRKYFGNSPISANDIFYVDIPPEKALGRIKQRARIGGESIPIEYLKKLQNEYKEYLTFADQFVPVYKSKQKEDTMSQVMTFINSTKAPICMYI